MKGIIVTAALALLMALPAGQAAERNSGGWTTAPMPPRIEHGRLQGEIVSYEARQGGELGMLPADMTVYILRFYIHQSELELMGPGTTVQLYSKLAPPAEPGLRWVSVVSAASRTAWLVGYDASQAGQPPP